VLLADDHKVMLQGLISVLESQPGIQVLGEASTGREAVEMARVLRPDVIVMDISMPGMDGIEATRRIKESVPQIRVVGLSMFEEQSVIDAMRQAGAEAFVKKTDTSNNVLRAIFGPSCRVPAPSGQVPTQVGDAPGPDSAGA
jgi:DNA-binding NarL/FixJ family response regulator